MKEYLITWQIEIEADTPEEAVKEALKIQRDPKSTAVIFEAQEQLESGEWGDSITVDLDPM